MANLGSPIIIDNGSYTIKAGFVGDNGPRIVFQNIVGKPRRPDLVSGDRNYAYIGEEVEAVSDLVTIKHPINNGIIENWEEIERIWNYTFYSQLKAAPSENPLLLTEIPFNPQQNRERMTQIAFETFEAPAFYAAIQPILCLYPSGMTTGLVLDSGDGVTHVVPVHEGNAIPNGIKKISVSGKDITNNLLNILKARGNSFSDSDGLKIARKIKESLCYVALDFYEEMANPASSCEEIFELPDGQVVNIGNEKFRAPETFFSPTFLGLDDVGCINTIYNSIMACDQGIRGDLGKIVLSGGNTMYPGIVERLTKELTEAFSSGIDFKISAPPERKFLVWIGASILATLSSFQQNWILKSEYDEVGPSIVHTKCPNFS